MPCKVVLKYLRNVAAPKETYFGLTKVGPSQTFKSIHLQSTNWQNDRFWKRKQSARLASHVHKGQKMWWVLMPSPQFELVPQSVPHCDEVLHFEKDQCRPPGHSQPDATKMQKKCSFHLNNLNIYNIYIYWSIKNLTVLQSEYAKDALKLCRSHLVVNHLPRLIKSKGCCGNARCSTCLHLVTMSKNCWARTPSSIILQALCEQSQQSGLSRIDIANGTYSNLISSGHKQWSLASTYQCSDGSSVARMDASFAADDCDGSRYSCCHGFQHWQRLS